MMTGQQRFSRCVPALEQPRTPLPSGHRAREPDRAPPPYQRHGMLEWLRVLDARV
jgi:hypothetical protein